jgi:hypothetical protein
VPARPGGWHIYLKDRETPRVFRNKLMKLVPSEEGRLKTVATGLEMEWTGGYVVALPSANAPETEADCICGYYTWVRPPGGPNPPKVPKWLSGVFQLEPLAVRGVPRAARPRQAMR